MREVKKRGRGSAFRPSEDRMIVSLSKDSNATELFDEHQRMQSKNWWPYRSKKSLARRVETLRNMGKLGLRAPATRRRAYFNRGGQR